MSRLESSIPATTADDGSLDDRRLAIPLSIVTTAHWLRARPGLLVAAIATLLSLIVTMPLVLHLTDDIYGYPGDATGGVTDFWWWGYALTHGKAILDNSLQGVPLGSEWSQTAFSPLPVFVFTPLSALIGPILSYNLLVLSGFPLTAWTTYLLARRLNLTPLPAAFAALTFAFTPYHLEKAQGHALQTHLEFLVGCLLMLIIWRATGKIRYAIAAGALAGLQTWTEPSIAYVMVFTVATFFLISLIVALVSESSKIRTLLRHLATGLLLLGTSAIFLPVAIIFIHRPGTPGTEAGPLDLTTRSLTEISIYSARFREYLQPYYNNPIVPSFIKRWELARLHASNWTESTILLGFTVIVLALLGLVLTRRLFPLALAAGLIMAGAIMSHQPVGGLLGVTFHYPSYYLGSLVAFFRAYARFAWLVLLGGSLLAGMGLATIEARLRPGRTRYLLAIPFLLAAVEFTNMPPTHVTAILPAPAEYTWLRSQPEGVLLEYPANTGNAQTQEVQIRQYLLYQMVHLHPTFLNESTTGVTATEARRLEPYYKPGVVDRLRSLGIHYVFVHESDYRADGLDSPHFVDGLRFVTEINGVAIYVVE